MDARKIVEECYQALPVEMKSKPWEFTNHGRKILKDENELNAYLAAYGEMHIIKCMAALQNFPFANIRKYTFEIFDWGCGQGIATLTLLDMLRERKLLGQLRAITLIEPSLEALKRAEDWITQNASPGIIIKCINKCIPNTEYAVMDEVTCNSQVCINLFSNILDIETLSLKWLAQKTGTLANTNYMICIGPKYNTNSRISDFCGYLNPQIYFSKISAHTYAYTTKTYHPFSCETRCFMHKRIEGIDENYKELAEQKAITEDYDYAAECMRGYVNDDLLNLYNETRSKCYLSYDVIFLKPAINTDTVDLLLAGLGKGIILLNICKESDIENIKIAIKRIENIKNIIIDTHLKTTKIDSIINKSVYNCIKIALYFPYLTETEINEKLQEIKATPNGNNDKNEELQEDYIYISKKTIEYLIVIGKDSNVIDIFSKQKANSFKSEYYTELINIIAGNWHSYKDGDENFHLNKKQEEIVRSTQTKIRIKGVAGCGKTQIVANRAVERHIQTGEKVLIITFNISLIQYIRMRISQVPADFAMNMFEITSYHQFFRSKANQYGKQKLSLCDWDNAKFFEPYKNNIEKYETIIIDEVQDFKEEWLSSIMNYFLKENGSISVFGDGEQNIYDRKLEQETKMPIIPTFSGRWGEINERISLRIQNKKIARLASIFSSIFIDESTPPLAIQQTLNFEDYNICYWNIGKNKEAKDISSNIEWIIENYRLSERSTVVLAETINLLRDIEFYYTHDYNKSSMINFETKEQYQNVQKQSSPTYIKQDLDAIRRAAKTHFTTNCNKLKLSTIHSFKGWEADSVILLLQPIDISNENIDDYHIIERENMPALIYTALTRARCNLFILNLGNSKYDDFFTKNIKK